MLQTRVILRISNTRGILLYLVIDMQMVTVVEGIVSRSAIEGVISNLGLRAGNVHSRVKAAHGQCLTLTHPHTCRQRLPVDQPCPKKRVAVKRESIICIKERPRVISPPEITLQIPLTIDH